MAVTVGREPGPTRIKLAEALETFGYRFRPENVHSNYPMAIGCSWDAYGEDKEGRSVHVHSFQTMKECLRRGFVLDHDDRDVFNHFEAIAK